MHLRQRPVRLVLRSSLASPPSFVPVCPARASTNQRRQVYLQRPSCLETIRLSSTQLAVKDSASIPASSQAHASADPLRPPSPVSSLRLVSESSAIGQCCCRRRCCCCFWSRPPPPPPHVWSQVTRGIDQRSSRVHISSSSGTGHAMPRPNLCPHSRARARAAFAAPLCLGVSGWRPSSPRPLRPGIRNDHERSLGTRTPRSRWCSHAPRHIA